jgi:hypothetical protein
MAHCRAFEFPTRRTCFRHLPDLTLFGAFLTLLPAFCTQTVIPWRECKSISVSERRFDIGGFSVITSAEIHREGF